MRQAINRRLILRIPFLGPDGMALFPFILVRHPNPGPVLLNHERIHLRQQVEMGVLFFYVWYVAEYGIRWLQYRNAYAAYRNISFEREAYLLMRLNHPAIVPVYDFGRDDTIMLLVMRLIRGPSLYQLSAQRHWSLQTICQILQPLAAALDYAHDQGVIHRDIKPGNVLIEPANALKAEPPTQTLDGSQIHLTDFGLSKTHTDTSLTVAGKSMGTPQYMSPEQVMNQPLDRRSDVYALAVLTYEALLGRLPFYGKNAQQVAFKHVTDSVPPPRQFIPRFPALVEAILLRALARNPKDRFPTAGVFSATFSQAVDRLNDAARRTDYWVGPPQTP